MTRALVGLLTLVLVGCAAEQRLVAQLPDRTLEAPDGRRHSTVALAARGAVFVVAPATLSSVDDQRDWGTHLDATRSGPAALVFVEDLGPSWFEDTVKEEMRKQYVSGGRVVMLLDEEGALREALGVPEGDVVVLVYSAERRLLKTIPGPPTREAAASAWAALAGRRGR
jgi:hypothetical protein